MPLPRRAGPVGSVLVLELAVETPNRLVPSKAGRSFARPQAGQKKKKKKGWGGGKASFVKAALAAQARR